MSPLSDAAVARLRIAAQSPQLPSDRYAITGEIGRGGMATVYAALDTTLGRDVAIKVVNAVASEVSEQRLSAESRVLAGLEHPGIVPVHDAGRLLDGRPFYVMKRVQGRTLTDYAREASELGERLRVFERVCEATAFAHANRILHRDLKPDNIMIGAFGEVMVMDWGVAKSLEQGGTDHGEVLGTPGFMAPEQAEGDDDLDERADVYSLGAILATLLTGHDARPLQSVRARAMATDRDDRYPSVVALREEIARFRAGRAVAAHQETALEKAGRIARVYRMPILLVLTYMTMRALVAIIAGW
jgi:serine/threonine protein kinase